VLVLVTAGCWFIGALIPAAVFVHRGPFVQLLVSYPTGRIRRRLALATVVAAYVTALIEGVTAVVWPRVLLAVVLAAASVELLARTSGPARKAAAPAAVAGCAFVVVLALGAANRLSGWRIDLPLLLGYDAVLVGAATVLVGYLIWGRWVDAVLSDLVTVLGRRGEVDRLGGRLRRALGDPSLVLGLWVRELGRYADEAGRPVAPPLPGRDRTATFIEDEDGTPLALLVHDPAVLEDRRLLEGVASAARLAVLNARMLTEIRSRVTELAASRRRIVEAADTERMRLERELAAGAGRRLEQVERLLADVGTPSTSDAEALTDLRAQLLVARAELSSFAQGIRPPTLRTGGLSEALPVLATTLPIPTHVDVQVARLPSTVESAVYFVCAEALTNVGKHARASEVSLSVRSEIGRLVATIEDDGVGGADPRGSGLRGLSDRIEALGGTFQVSDRVSGGTRLEIQVPLTRTGALDAGQEAPS